MNKREWLLGEDLLVSDNLLDPITFEELIMTVHCNCREITPKAVKKELIALLEYRLDDVFELFGRNLDKIMDKARVGREE